MKQPLERVEVIAREKVMRLYSSFLVRCWLTEDALQGAQSVLQIDHIQTGASRRATNLSELEPWVLEACRTARSKGGPSGETEANVDDQSRLSKRYAD
jgi:hypothetical protein